MNVLSLDFWLEVQQEYKPTPSDYYVCNNSFTFAEAWYYLDFSNDYIYRDQIIELSKEFAEPISQNHTVGFADLLFCTDKVDLRSKLRLDFIQFCVNKFSPLNK
jgi:hypothetical protein